MRRRRFVKVTGSYSVLLTATGALTACGHSGSPDKDQQLLEQSIKAFKRFSDVWDFEDFWKRGNTFDACLVFVDALRERWPDNDEVRKIQKAVRDMLEENLHFFGSYDPGTLWADDFGWWGLMGLNACEHLLKIGEKELADEYLALSIDLCWEYKRKTAYDHSETGTPIQQG